MQDNCILCGQEVQRGGFSAKVEGVVLRPLCPSCDAWCSKEPRKIFDEHRDIFERMRRRESITSPIGPAEVSGPAPDHTRNFLGNQGPQIRTAAQERSQRERPLSNRYVDAYRVAQASVVLGNTIKAIGAVLAGLIFIAALFLASQMNGIYVIGTLFWGVVLGGVIGIVFFVLGTLLGAHGQLLRATLDTAVHTSPFLADDLKSEIMSL